MFKPVFGMQQPLPALIVVLLSASQFQEKVVRRECTTVNTGNFLSLVGGRESEHNIHTYTLVVIYGLAGFETYVPSSTLIVVLPSASQFQEKVIWGQCMEVNTRNFSFPDLWPCCTPICIPISRKRCTRSVEKGQYRFTNACWSWSMGLLVIRPFFLTTTTTITSLDNWTFRKKSYKRSVQKTTQEIFFFCSAMNQNIRFMNARLPLSMGLLIFKPVFGNSYNNLH